jgi:hypothetical protein
MCTFVRVCLDMKLLLGIILFFSFLGAFVKLQKATISFDMSVRPSVFRRGTTGLPLDRFS